MSNKQIEVKMNKDELDNKIVIYQTEDGKTQLDVKLENETV